MGCCARPIAEPWPSTFALRLLDGPRLLDMLQRLRILDEARAAEFHEKHVEGRAWAAV